MYVQQLIITFQSIIVIRITVMFDADYLKKDFNFVICPSSYVFTSSCVSKSHFHQQFLIPFSNKLTFPPQPSIKHSICL